MLQKIKYHGNVAMFSVCPIESISGLIRQGKKNAPVFAKVKCFIRNNYLGFLELAWTFLKQCVA